MCLDTTAQAQRGNEESLGDGEKWSEPLTVYPIFCPAKEIFPRNTT